MIWPHLKRMTVSPVRGGSGNPNACDEIALEELPVLLTDLSTFATRSELRFALVVYT